MLTLNANNMMREKKKDIRKLKELTEN